MLLILYIAITDHESGEISKQASARVQVEMLIEDDQVPPAVDLGLAEQRENCKPEIIPKNDGNLINILNHN